MTLTDKNPPEQTAYDGASNQNSELSEEQVNQAAAVLTQFYGEGALARARLLEERLPTSTFARSVREKLESKAS